MTAAGIPADQKQLGALVQEDERQPVEFGHWKAFQADYLAPLMAMWLLKRTVPDKSRSRMQRYGTVDAGLAASKEPERES